MKRGVKKGYKWSKEQRRKQAISQRHFTDKDKDFMVKSWFSGKTIDYMAVELDRTYKSVKDQLSILRGRGVNLPPRKAIKMTIKYEIIK